MIILIFDNGKTSSHIAKFKIFKLGIIPTTYLITESSKKIHRCTSLAYLMLKPYVLMYLCQKITKKL